MAFCAQRIALGNRQIKLKNLDVTGFYMLGKSVKRMTFSRGLSRAVQAARL